MFREALLESSPALHRRSPWPMATAFTLQLIIAAVVVLVPLVSSGILPLTAHLAPPPQYVPVEPVKSAPTTATSSNPTAVHVPRFEIVRLASSDPGPINPRVGITRGAPSDADPLGDPQLEVLNGDPNATSGLIETHTTPPAAPRPLRISHSMDALLLKKVIPEYPNVAKLAGQQGDVKLHAIIAKDGTIQSLTVTSGPPLLQEAALKAVQQWRYRPYMLNGQAVEVETVITVSFKRT